MGLLDWLRPRRRARFASEIARDLAAAVFALHPAARDTVVLQLGQLPGHARSVVVSMDVPVTDPARTAEPPPDRALQTARISELVAELATALPRADSQLTVMRDRVIWMPAVIPFHPPLS